MNPGQIAYVPSPAGYTSASQVELFSKCERAWWFRSVAKIPTPSTAPQAFGTGTHGVVEHYLKGTPIPAGTDPKMLDILEVAKKFLPDPKVGGYRVEGRIEIPTYLGGPIWQGFIDLWEENKHPPEVTDHKTTSNFRYAKTPQELESNVQMVSYAKWAFLNLHTNVVRISHLYLLTKGKPKAHKVSTDLTLPQVNKEWSKSLEKVKRMTSLKVVTSSDDMLPNGVDTGHCHAYGGCPYRVQCGLTLSNLITVGKAKPNGEYSMSSLKEKLMAARAAMNGAPPVAPLGVVPPDAPPRTQPPETIGPPGDVEAARLAKAYGEGTLATAVAQTAPARPAPVTPAATAQPTHPQGSAEPILAAPAAPAKKRGRPSKADLAARAAATPPPPVNTEVETGRMPAVHVPKVQGAFCAACGGIAQLYPSGEFMDHQGVDDELKETTETPCVGSGDAPESLKVWVTNRRVELAALAAARSGEPVVTEVVEVPVEPGHPVETATVPTKPAAKLAGVGTVGAIQYRTAPEPTPMPGFHLYYGCLPVKGEHKEYTLAEEWLAPIAAEVAKVNNVKDYRMIQYMAKGALAVGIGLAREENRVPRVLVIAESLPGADVILETLVPFARSVTKRF